VKGIGKNQLGLRIGLLVRTLLAVAEDVDDAVLLALWLPDVDILQKTASHTHSQSEYTRHSSSSYRGLSRTTTAAYKHMKQALYNTGIITTAGRQSHICLSAE